MDLMMISGKDTPVTISLIGAENEQLGAIKLGAKGFQVSDGDKWSKITP